MSYHMTVDHRPAPQIPALLKYKLKSPSANWSCGNVGTPFPRVENSKPGRSCLPDAEAGVGTTAVPPAAACCSSCSSHGSHRSTPTRSLQINGAGGGGSNSLDYDNTWYYQSNCALAESGVQQVLHNLGFIDDRIYKTSISPKNWKEKSSTKPYTKIHC